MTRYQEPAREACRFQKTQTYSSSAAIASAPRAARRQGGKSPAQQRGAAVVEFALILPILLGLLVGGIDASLALYDKAVITNASREGARAGIVARNPPLTDAQIRQVVNQYAQSALVSLGANPAQPTVTIQKGSLGGDPTLQVTVSYTFEGIGLGSLFQSLGKPWVLQASTEMVYE
jgi:Flp pilus assembly protein TadG